MFLAEAIYPKKHNFCIQNFVLKKCFEGHKSFSWASDTPVLVMSAPSFKTRVDSLLAFPPVWLHCTQKLDFGAAWRKNCDDDKNGNALYLIKIISKRDHSFLLFYRRNNVTTFCNLHKCPLKVNTQFSSGFRISQRRGRQPWRWVRQPIILCNFPQNLQENC